MTITSLLNTAFAQSFVTEVELHRRWNRVFARLHNMGAIQAEQSDGRFDILLRKIEAEMLITLNQPDPHEVVTYAPDTQSALSRYWILSTYESVRTAHETEAGQDHAGLSQFRRRIEMLRVPLAKAEIFNDTRMKEPTTFVRIPHGEGFGEPDPRQYSKDRKFPYRPGKGICTQTGSFGWYVFNSRTGSDEFITRRMLSDECLTIFDRGAPMS